jgi:hypothetical protein
MSLVLTERGAVVQSVTAGANPQARRTTALLEDALRGALPMLPDGEVRARHTWEDVTPAVAPLQGQIARRYTLIQVDGERALIEVKLDGALQSPEGELRLQGRGQITLDRAAEQVSLREYALTLEVTSKGAGEASWTQRAQTQIKITRQ